MTSFVGWGGAWGDSWGPLTTDPNAMRGTAQVTITAAGDLTGLGDGFMVGSAGMSVLAAGTLTALAAPSKRPGDWRKWVFVPVPMPADDYEEETAELLLVGVL